jgi:hypothetical protein
MKIHFLLLLCITGYFFVTGVSCKYNFTGASVAPDIKTVSVAQFENTAGVVVASLSQQFSEKVRDKFLTQSNLSLATREGDLQVSGVITGYTIAPITIQGNTSAAQNRVTMTVMCKFQNLKYPDKSWEQVFSNFADYSSTLSYEQVESQILEEINDKIAQDIFNKALADW